jgi:hypothetical protein
VRKILEGLDETVRDGGGHYEEAAARRDADMLREALAQVGRPQSPQSTGRWHVVRQYSNGCETGPAIYLDNQWMATIVGAPHLGFRSVEMAERICAAMNWETAEPPRPAAIEQAIRDYYFALDNREHGGVAANTALNRIQEILGMRWHQGEEKRRREEVCPMCHGVKFIGIFSGYDEANQEDIYNDMPCPMCNKEQEQPPKEGA